MKKILPFIILVLFFLFIPIVYAEENIVIESIELDSKSDNATIVSEATYDGLLMILIIVNILRMKYLVIIVIF